MENFQKKNDKYHYSCNYSNTGRDTGWYTYDVHENSVIFNPLPPLPCPSTSKILLPPWFWTSKIKWTPPLPHLPPSLQMITNQLRENIIQRWLSYVIRSFLQVGFRFQYQLINLVWLSFDFFSFSWSLTICFSVTLYSCMCSCSTKCITTKNTVISPDFLVWKFCGKAQFPHSFDRIAGNYTETVLFRKISTPGNQVKLQYFSQCILFIFIHIISTHFAINLFYLHNLNM